MSRGSVHGVDMRSFRWPLQPLERKLDGGLEAARLALASLKDQAKALDQLVAEWKKHQEQQERAASASIERDPRMGSHVLRYLATLQARLGQAAIAGAELGLRVGKAQGDCVERQRQLACVQALREQAQRIHAAAQLRREAREADAAWLVRRAQRRAAGRGEGA